MAVALQDLYNLYSGTQNLGDFANQAIGNIANTKNQGQQYTSNQLTAPESMTPSYQATNTPQTISQSPTGMNNFYSQTPAPVQPVAPTATQMPINLSTPETALNQAALTQNHQPQQFTSTNQNQPRTYSDIEPGTPVQTPAGMGTAPPVAPNGAVMPQQTTPQQTVPQQTTPPATTTPPVQEAAPMTVPHVDNFVTNQTDANKMAELAYDKTTPPDVQKAAAEQHFQLVSDQKKKEEAQKKIQETLESGNTSDFARMLAKESKEGSYIKAFLYHGLGLHELGKNEEQKLGARNQWQSTIDADGNRALINFDANGLATQGYNSEGKALTRDQLAKFAASAGPTKGAEVHTQMLRDRNTGEIYYQRTLPNGTTQLINNKGQQFAGNTNDLYAYGIGSDLNILGQKLNMETINSLRRKHGENVLDAEKEFVERNGPFGSSRNPVSREQFREGYGLNSGMPSSNTIQPLQPPTPSVTPQQKTTMPIEPVQPKTAMVQTNLPANETPGGFIKTASQSENLLNTPLAEQKINQNLKQKAGETGIEVGGKRSEGYNKYLDEQVADQARKGYDISSERKRQFGILNRPGVDTDKIFGLYNAAGNSPDAQKGAIIRDILGGVYKEPKDLSQRLAQLDLDPATRSALEEYNISNATINRSTLKATAGAGGVSDAEQEANKKSNVDPTKIPALGGYNAMAQSQFNGDLAQYKGDWAVSHNFNNTLELERAWRKEQSKLNQMYKAIAEERIKFINEHGNTTAAVKEGYRRFPIPEYDADTESWRKTKPLNQILGR